MRPRKLRRILAAMAAGAVLAGTAMGYAARAEALPNPYVPEPAQCCPGDGPRGCAGVLG